MTRTATSAVYRMNCIAHVRGFHEEVLKDGGVPLQVLQVKVQRWIDRQQEPSSR